MSDLIQRGRDAERLRSATACLTQAQRDLGQVNTWLAGKLGVCRELVEEELRRTEADLDQLRKEES